MKKTIFLILIIITFNKVNAQTNTNLGYESNVNNSGTRNTSLGYQALKNNISGDGNVAVGSETLLNNQSGKHNIGIGRNTMSNNNSGSNNVALGFYSLSCNSSGENNLAIGNRAYSGVGTNNLITYPGEIFTGSNNIALGFQSLNYNFMGNSNISQGYKALFDMNTGNQNIAIGFLCGANLISGNNNVFIGKVTLPSASSNFNDKIIIANGSGSQRIYVDENGNTGIGLGNNVAPSNRLEIKHGSNGSSGLRFTNLKNTNNAINNPTSRVLSVNDQGDVILVNDMVGTGSTNQTTINAGTNVTVTGDPISGYVINSTATGETDVNIYEDNGTLTGDRIVTMGNNNLNFSTSSATGGKIIIGSSSSPGDYRLYVDKGILTEKVRVAIPSSANWADYVFEENYKLMTLQEVERYIEKNKHLPNIPSAKELESEGLDLGVMQAKQMEKIEELTLYAIEQKKQIDRQAKEIEELRGQIKILLEKK